MTAYMNIGQLGQPDILSQFFSNCGFYDMGVQDEDAASKAFEASYEYALKSKNEFRQVQMLSRLGEIYRNKKDFRKSAELLRRAVALSRALNDKPGEMDLAKLLSSIYANDLYDDRLAVGYFTEYVRLSDILNETASRRKVNELEAQHRIQRKEDSIMMLQRQGHLRDLLLKRTTALSSSLIAASLLLLSLALVIIINYKRKHQLVAMQSVLQGLIVAGMQKMLAAIDEIKIAGTAGSAIEALKILNSVPVDIALLDINLPDINGIELCKKIKKEFPAVKVLGISTYCDRSYVSRMIENGALGYLAKSADAEEIVRAIRTAGRGQLYLSLSTEQLLQPPSVPTSPGTLPALTRREKEVLQLIADGLTNPQIAENLFISPLTVDSHRKNLLTKLNVNNTAALVRLAVEQRLL